MWKVVKASMAITLLFKAKDLKFCLPSHWVLVSVVKILITKFTKSKKMIFGFETEL